MSTKSMVAEPGEAEVGDPWGSVGPALTAGSAVPPLPARLAVLAGVHEQRELDLATDPELVAAVAAGAVHAAELPEVAALAAEGWRALEPAPVYVGVPAAWPTRHRGWVPDRLPHLAVPGPDDAGRQWIRIWLLRSPWPAVGVEVLLGLGNARGHQTHPGARPHVAFPCGGAGSSQFAAAGSVQRWSPPRHDPLGSASIAGPGHRLRLREAGAVLLPGTRCAYSAFKPRSSGLNRSVHSLKPWMCKVS